MARFQWLLGHSRLFWIISLLALGLVCGTAGQNLVLGLTFLLALPRRWRGHWVPANRAFRWMTLVLLAFLVWTMAATALNPQNFSFDSLPNFIGYLPLVILPAFLSDRLAGHPGESRDFKIVLAAIFALWALICISQAVVGWRLSGTAIEYNTFYARARGIYSHPLTLAYVALILWPPALRRLLGEPRDKLSWIYALTVGLLIALSQSRTVQVLAGLCLLLNVILTLRGRWRYAVLGSCLVAILLLALTDNPITSRFRSNAPSREKAASAYPDDRVVFWHAHWEMIKDRPWTGHGIHLNADYRRPYYERIGQANFPKKYEAHNQFIQVAAESGAIGLLLFCGWLAACWRFLGELSPAHRSGARQALALFILGGLTQNAFFDSEVRYCITACFVLALLLIPGRVEDSV